MSYLEKIRACNACDLTGFRRFVVDGTPYGWIAAARADVLQQHDGVFVCTNDAVSLHPRLATAEQRTAAIDAITPALIDSGAFAAPTGERYAVRNDWSKAPALLLDRALVPAFGVRAYGVHLNGIVRKSEGLYLWIGTRAADRQVEPNKLDNVVAGGQPAGLSLTDNVIKECGEEAGFSPALARAARPAGAVTYALTTPKGLRNDVLFCYDLELPADVTPVNRDGEIAAFKLLPADEVLRLVRNTETFKFNVPLVIIDFAVRHGLITAENEPDYLRIVAELRMSPQNH